MAWKDYIIWEPLTIVAASAITTSFVAVITITAPAICMLIKNGTNGDVLLGIDGTTAKWGFPASSGAAYDMTTNSPTYNQLMLREGTTIYIEWNGSAPSIPTGNVYIEFMEVAV